MRNARRNLFRSPIGHPSRPSRSVRFSLAEAPAPPLPAKWRRPCGRGGGCGACGANGDRRQDWGGADGGPCGVSVGSYGVPNNGAVVPIQHEGVRHPKVLQLPPALGRAAESILQDEGMGL